MPHIFLCQVCYYIIKVNYLILALPLWKSYQQPQHTTWQIGLTDLWYKPAANRYCFTTSTLNIILLSLKHTLKKSQIFNSWIFPFMLLRAAVRGRQPLPGPGTKAARVREKNTPISFLLLAALLLMPSIGWLQPETGEQAPGAQNKSGKGREWRITTQLILMAFLVFTFTF